jgi:hypothetical protein
MIKIVIEDATEINLRKSNLMRIQKHATKSMMTAVLTLTIIITTVIRISPKELENLIRDSSSAKLFIEPVSRANRSKPLSHVILSYSIGPTSF